MNLLPAPLRHIFLCMCISFSTWTSTALANTVEPLGPIYLYASPITAAFFSANHTNYDTLRVRWRDYLRTFYGKNFKEASRENLLAGLKPGVLVLGSAVLLDDQERKAIRAFSNAGGSVLATWGTGARDARGHWTGYGFLEELFELKIVGQVTEGEQRFLNSFGDHPLTWASPGGLRIYLGDVAEVPLRVDSANLAARYFDWQRFPTAKKTNGAIAFSEKNGSRRAYFGFSESSWEYDSRLELPVMLDSILSWLRREPRVFKTAWPYDAESAQLLEMDTEDKYPNALNFAAQLDAANIRGTFYSLTGVAIKHGDVARKLAEKHEIGYHAEVHVGFKGKELPAQEARLAIMVNEMKNIVGSRMLPNVTGFRAPTESWDENTERLLRKIGIRHHVTDPAATDARLPAFSRSEPGLSTEDAIVVLPRTQMDDLNYQGLKLSEEKGGEMLALDFDYLHEAGALGILSVHSQNYAPDGFMAKLTPAYIKRLQEHRADVWTASGEEIEGWWRARERVTHQPFKNLGTELTFQVKEPAKVRGIKFYVTHPAANAVLKSVVALAPGLPQPEFKKMDAYRSSIIFTQELKSGQYAYRLEF